MASVKMTWTFDMRLLLDMLFEPEAGRTPGQRSKAFDSMFKDQIRRFGFVDGIPYRRLTAQYHERKKLNKDWVRICSSTQSAADVEKRRSMRARLDSFLQSQPSVCHTSVKKRPRDSNDDVHHRQGDPAPLSKRPRDSNDGVRHRQRRDPTLLSKRPRDSNDGVHHQQGDPTPPSKRPRDSNDDVHHHQQGDPTPLSKRPAIGLWTPETPQRPSRPAAKIAKTLTPRRPILTKPKSPKSARLRPDGSTILVSENLIIRDLVPSISQHRAQPPLPKLLFRLWREDPSGRDSKNGFWSRRHHKKNALSSNPPRSSSIDATDIFDHMNRSLVDTPFISTSNRLIWIVQQIVNAIKDNSGQWHVSVIDVDALDNRGVFWARPFHDEVRLSKPFTRGAGNYRGTYEFLIWQKIPEAAIVHTFKARDLLNLALTDEINKTMRFDVLYPRAALATKIATLRRQEVALSDNAVETMATLVNSLGIQSPYNAGHVSAIVTGICEGWGLDIQHRDEKEWQQLAGHFATRLRSFEARERQAVKFAFLDGVAWGCGEPNAKHTAEAIQQKIKRATAVGLASPSDILAHELDALKLALKLQEKENQRVLQAYHDPARSRRPQHRIELFEFDESDNELGHLEMTGEDDHFPAEDEELAHGEEEEIMFDSEGEDDFPF